MKELTYLDLTSCLFHDFSLQALTDLVNLKALILYNVWPIEHEFHILYGMKKLQTLDLSIARVNTNLNGNYLMPDKVSLIH